MGQPPNIFACAPLEPATKPTLGPCRRLRPPIAGRCDSELLASGSADVKPRPPYLALRTRGGTLRRWNQRPHGTGRDRGTASLPGGELVRAAGRLPWQVTAPPACKSMGPRVTDPAQSGRHPSARSYSVAPDRGRRPRQSPSIRAGPGPRESGGSHSGGPEEFAPALVPASRAETAEPTGPGNGRRRARSPRRPRPCPH